MLFTENGKKNLIRKWRVYNGWTQEELAEKAKISTNLIRLYELNQKTLKYQTAKKIADLFGISLNQLYEEGK